jgi:predicted adenylyl cyclase CyaB
MIQNVEIKARCDDPRQIRDYLLSHHAIFKGIDQQRDTYFNVNYGRLKLRQGKIENALIHYLRNDQKGPKRSEVTLFPVSESNLLRSLLEKALGIKVVVEKQREIYFIENVKFHIDIVQKLGNFIEIEAIDEGNRWGMEKIQSQCQFYLQAFGIREDDLLQDSYSDQLLKMMHD